MKAKSGYRNPLRLCYFARVASSPITWDNVILYGEYVLDRDLIRL